MVVPTMQSGQRSSTAHVQNVQPLSRCESAQLSARLPERQLAQAHNDTLSPDSARERNVDALLQSLGQEQSQKLLDLAKDAGGTATSPRQALVSAQLFEQCMQSVAGLATRKPGAAEQILECACNYNFVYHSGCWRRIHHSIRFGKLWLAFAQTLRVDETFLICSKYLFINLYFFLGRLSSKSLISH